VTTGHHKLIHYYQLGEWELFDLEKDPNELENVSANADYAETRQRLEKELRRLRQLYRVPEEDPESPRKRKKPAPKK
jgi:hypothetical protein